SACARCRYENCEATVRFARPRVGRKESREVRKRRSQCASRRIYCVPWPYGPSEIIKTNRVGATLGRLQRKQKCWSPLKRGGGYFLRKRSSRTTSPPPPLVGFSDFSGLEAEADERVCFSFSGSLAATGTGGLGDERFFLLFAADGSWTFAGAGRSSPFVTSSNCRPN